MGVLYKFDSTKSLGVYITDKSKYRNAVTWSLDWNMLRFMQIKPYSTMSILF